MTNQTRPGGDQSDWSWDDTRPFSGLDGEPARFELRQVADNQFRLLTPFTYQRRDGLIPTPVVVDSGNMDTTDLASVPWFMSWFVSSYGRHTPAALTHDLLTPDERTDTSNRQRREADHLFLQAMDDLDMPPVRSRVMWAAVVLATKWANRPMGTVALIAWFLASAGGTTALIAFGLRGSPLALVALVGPFIGAVLWGRDYRAGVVAGYGVWLTALPALASVLIHYGAYWPLEKTIQIGRKLLIPGNRKRQLPAPLSYNEA